MMSLVSHVCPKKTHKHSVLFFKGHAHTMIAQENEKKWKRKNSSSSLNALNFHFFEMSYLHRPGSKRMENHTLRSKEAKQNSFLISLTLQPEWEVTSWRQYSSMFSVNVTLFLE